MAYRVKEIFYTLQGEGARAGRAAVFCRFSGCNLWSGRAEDRASAACPFCDTDFTGTNGPGGGVFAAADELAAAILAHFPAFAHPAYRPYVVFTGGEPALQLDEALLARLHAAGCELAVESNGTLPLPPGLDWVTISPKAGTQLATRAGQELKLVWPQQGLGPDDLAEFERLDFAHFFLQPCGSGGRGEDARAGASAEAVRACLTRPVWRLSLQAHKYIGIP